MSKKDMCVVQNAKFNKGMHKVNTTVAYDAWGIDINDLEKRRKKLKALELQ